MNFFLRIIFSFTNEPFGTFGEQNSEPILNLNLITYESKGSPARTTCHMKTNVRVAFIFFQFLLPFFIINCGRNNILKPEHFTKLIETQFYLVCYLYEPFALSSERNGAQKGSF